MKPVSPSSSKQPIQADSPKHALATTTTTPIHKRWGKAAITWIKDKTIEWVVIKVLLILYPLVAYVLGLKVPDRNNATWISYVQLLITLNYVLFVSLLLFLLLIAVSVGFVFLGRSYKTRYAELEAEYHELIKENERLEVDVQIAKDLGLINFFPITKYNTQKDVEVDLELRERAEDQIIAVVGSGVADIDMILVTGYRVIGPKEKEGFLIPIMKQQKGVRYNIFLINPTFRGRIIEERAERIGQTLAEYLNGVNEVVEHLKFLKTVHKINLHLWFYSETPIFQMFKTTEEIWVQSAVSFKTDIAPLCGFRKSDYSLYWSMRRFWERMWIDWGTKKREIPLGQPNQKQQRALRGGSAKQESPQETVNAKQRSLRESSSQAPDIPISLEGE